MRCLICDMEGSGSGLSCKLCGMLSQNPVSSGRHSFCCKKCAADFRGIMERASDAERDSLLKTETVI